MEKLRFCHSVWTEPMFSGRWHIGNQFYHNIWMFALSAALIKKAGHSIVLHTDSRGRELFGFLPYDEVYTTLDALDSDPLFWASGKILAQQSEPLGSTHIDGDAFIFNSDLFELVSNSKGDLFVQSKESFDDVFHLLVPYTLALDALAPALKRAPIDFDLSFDLVFNCGLVRFNNQVLKDEYISGYWTFLKEILSDQSVLKVLDGNKDITPDLVLEQLWLYKIVKSRNYTYSCFGSKELSSNGFVHFVGKGKYSNNFMIKCELIKADLDLFYKVSKFLEDHNFREV